MLGLFKGDYADEAIIYYHEQLYDACGLEKPKVIILDSYLLCKASAYVFSKINQFIKIETVKYYKKNKNDKKYLLDHLFENWHNLLDGFFYNNDNVKKNSAIKALDSHVRKHIENVVLENEKHLFLKISNFFENLFFSEKKENKKTKKQLQDIFGNINYFLAFHEGKFDIYDYDFQNKLILELDFLRFNASAYTAFCNIFHCCLGSLQQDQYVFVLRNAEKKNKLHKNGRLHSVDDYAYKFLDGTGFYFFRGQRVAENLFKSLSEQKYTFEDFKEEKNEEIKSLILAFYEEKFGSDFVFNFISQNLIEIDTFVHKKSEKYLEGTKKGMNIGVYTLFKDKDKNVKFAYVRCYCPSTDRMFFLGVPPHFTDAKNAIASLCEVPRELKDNLVSIRRQGEIFSFTFDGEGTKKLKEKSVDLKRTVSLTGDEYFNKIEFEY